MKQHVLSGDVFIFINRRRNQVKLLCWDKDGLAVYHKRLEKGTFELFNSAIRTLFAVAVLLVVVGFYLYYAIRTAFWNLFKKTTRGNLPLLVGVIIHLIFIVYSAVDFARFYAIDKVIIVIPFILIGFVIGVFDVQKLFKSWNYKWGKTTSAHGRVIKP